MERHTLQSVVAGKGHPAGQQLWHLKLLVLELAGEWGKQPPRSYWGSEVTSPIPTHDALEMSRSQAPAPKHCLHPYSLLCQKPHH